MIEGKEKKEGKCGDIKCNSKSDKISLVNHTNETKKMKRAKQKKNRWAIKSENGHKNLCDPSEKLREGDYGGKDLWKKVSFESGVEQRWSDA